MTPLFLTHESAGAPSWTSAPNSLNTILKWALPQLGWTVAFDDPSRSMTAYRNNDFDGSGCYLKVIDDPAHMSSADAVAGYAEVQGFITMSDIDSGTGQWPLTGGKFWKLSDMTGPEYAVIGDDRTFYFAIKQRVDRSFFLHHAGDIHSYKPLDKSHFFITGAEDSIFTASSSLGNGALSTLAIRGTSGFGYSFSESLAESHDGMVLNGETVQLFSLVNPLVVGFADIFMGANGDYPNPVSGGLNIAPIYVRESESELYRGELRGIWNPHSRLSNRQFLERLFIESGAVRCVPVNVRFDRDEVGSVVLHEGEWQ
jgi:hypothetical protein